MKTKVETANLRRKETFAQRRSAAIESHGSITPNLGSLKVDVIAVEPHSYIGPWSKVKKAAKTDAKNLYRGKYYLAKDSEGNPYVFKISGVSIKKYLDDSAIKKSVNNFVHLSLLPKITDVIYNSIEVETHPDYHKGADESRRIENGYDPTKLIHRLYGAFTMRNEHGEMIVYRVKTTMVESNDSTIGNYPHSYEVSNIEVIADETATTSDGIQGSTSSREGTLDATKLLKGVRKSYAPAGEIPPLVLDISQTDQHQRQIDQSKPQLRADNSVAGVELEAVDDGGISFRYTDPRDNAARSATPEDSRHDGKSTVSPLASRKSTNQIIDEAVSIFSGVPIKTATQRRLQRELAYRQETADLHRRILNLQFDDVTLQKNLRLCGTINP